MSKVDIYLLDNSNITIEKIDIIKPNSLKDLYEQLKQKLKYIPERYEIFIVDKNNKENKINNEEKFKIIGDILFVRGINKINVKQSNFTQNYARLSESKREIFDQKYSCILCTSIIKNENPYMCYKCQTIYHEKCLKEWDKECKAKNKVLICPTCRNELPIEKWNKKLNYEEYIKDNANLMFRLNDYKLNTNMNKNINIIKDEKINELKNHEMKNHEIIKRYEKYIGKIIDIFKNILYKINSIYPLIEMKNTNKFIDLINKLSLDFNNLPLYEIENTICNELERFKNYIINLNKRKALNMYTNVINSNQIINKKNNIDNNINNSTKINYRKIKTMPEFHSNFNYIDNNNLYNINSNIAYDINNYYNNNQNNEFQNNQYITKITLKYFAQTQGNYNIFGRQFIENNEKNIDLIINGKRSHLIDNYILNNGENTITLLIKNKLINLSYMFSWCNSLSNIEELKYLDVKYSNDFSYMFCGCSSLSDISPLKHWNVSSGKNFSSMFCNCTALSDLNPIKNWNVSNGNNFQYMFYGCSSLTDLHPLQNWNVSNKGEFEKMFSGCSLILDAEPIPNWSISKEKYDSLI